LAIIDPGEAAMRQFVSLCSLAFVLLVVSGCTEMRVEGDAKIFQTSDTGIRIRTCVGLGLLGLGGERTRGLEKSRWFE
jgi:hypothetical protein